MTQPINNFLILKRTFKDETGLDADKEIALYIQYYQAKTMDIILQHIHLDIQQLTVDLKSKK